MKAGVADLPEAGVTEAGVTEAGVTEAGETAADVPEAGVTAAGETAAGETVADPPVRKPDAARTRRDILDVARQEFAENGFSGARVDAIAARMRTTKRMIYYYFGSKQGLYLAVLEQAYSGIRSMEQQLQLDRLPPVEALRRVIDVTFDYHEAHPEFVRLVSIENIHHARNLAQSAVIQNLNSTIIESLAAILRRGRDAGAFRTEIDPVDLHLLISAPCFYRVSNRGTFGTLFCRDLNASDVRERHKRMIEAAIIGLLTAGEAVAPPGTSGHG
jgi:AcrR family transcriptional regulator